MALSAKQLASELAAIVDPSFASAIVESYVEMQQRFFAGDWQPSELDGGRLCEAISRAIYRLDSGTITNTQNYRMTFVKILRMIAICASTTSMARPAVI